MRRVSLIEDEAQVRVSCRQVLEVAGWTCHEIASADAAMDAAAHGHLGRVALVDLELEGVPRFDMLRVLQRAQPSTQLVALTAHAGDDWLFPALAAGCVGFVLKFEAVRRLVAVVEEASTGGTPLTPSVARRILERFRLAPTGEAELLSSRELQVLACLAAGLTYEETARDLEITLSTVRTHVERIYRKLGVTTKAAAATEALRRGLLR